LQWLHPQTVVSTLVDGHSFGRDPGCDTVLHSPEVSRRHAVIRSAGIFPVLRDLQSRNGLYVNGVRVEEQRLGPGDIIRIGDWLGIALERTTQERSLYTLHEVAPGWYAGSQLMAEFQPAWRAARAALPFVVQGETGTGKEGIARAIHALSGRKGAFVAVDCGAFAEQLAEAALFGHRKGAFTGADRAQSGFLRAADGGTLFLDEILNLSATLQAKLLRALEQQAVVPLGETQAVACDLRVVCAAQASLREAAQNSRFRPDLLARLDGFTLELPPLRKRREDIVPLFLRLLADHGYPNAECEPRLLESLLLYDWPLNVRELVMLVRRLVAVCGHTDLTRAMLPEWIVSARGESVERGVRNPTRNPTDDASEFAALLASLREHAGNLTQASAALKISRSRAYRLIEAHPEVDISQLRGSSEP
jgi:DNA-binding NtrC family response regulator